MALALPPMEQEVKRKTTQMNLLARTSNDAADGTAGRFFCFAGSVSKHPANSKFGFRKRRFLVLFNVSASLYYLVPASSNWSGTGVRRTTMTSFPERGSPPRSRPTSGLRGLSS